MHKIGVLLYAKLYRFFLRGLLMQRENYSFNLEFGLLRAKH